MVVGKVKVKELARELGRTSRELVNRCRAEGMFVQNSITKLTAAQARQVREWFARNEGDDSTSGDAGDPRST